MGIRQQLPLDDPKRHKHETNAYIGMVPLSRPLDSSVRMLWVLKKLPKNAPETILAV